MRKRSSANSNATGHRASPLRPLLSGEDATRPVATFPVAALEWHGGFALCVASSARDAASTPPPPRTPTQLTARAHDALSFVTPSTLPTPPSFRLGCAAHPSHLALSVGREPEVNGYKNTQKTACGLSTHIEKRTRAGAAGALQRSRKWGTGWVREGGRRRGWGGRGDGAGSHQRSHALPVALL